MTRHDVPHTLRRTLATALTLAAIAALAAVTPSRAQLPSPLELHAEIHDGVLDLLRTLDRIPDRIERHHRRHLEVFFGGNSYDRHHRHEHATYHFPVWVDGDVAYRPFTYCGDRLYQPVEYRPTLWSSWGRPGHGSWCSHHRGYYPTAHSCFRRTYVAPRPVHHHDRWCGHSVERRYDRRREHRCDDRCDHRYDRRDHRYDRRDDRRDDRRWDRRDHRHDRSCNHGRDHDRGRRGHDHDD
jgi:hypothetical protein